MNDEGLEAMSIGILHGHVAQLKQSISQFHLSPAKKRLRKKADGSSGMKIDHLALVDFPINLVRYILPQHHLAQSNQKQRHQQPSHQSFYHGQVFEPFQNTQVLRAAAQEFHAAEVERTAERHAGARCKMRTLV